MCNVSWLEILDSLYGFLSTVWLFFIIVCLGSSKFLLYKHFTNVIYSLLYCWVVKPNWKLMNKRVYCLKCHKIWFEQLGNECKLRLIVWQDCDLKFVMLLKSIQGTCRLSLKMGMGDEQKPLMHCIRTVINIDFRSSEMPALPNNGIFKLICWGFADPLNRLYQEIQSNPFPNSYGRTSVPLSYVQQWLKSWLKSWVSHSKPCTECMYKSTRYTLLFYKFIETTNWIRNTITWRSKLSWNVQIHHWEIDFND